MADFLIADIGGTTSRAALASQGGRPERIVTIANDSVDGPEGVLARLLDGANQRPHTAVLAFAAPVNGEEIALTNRNWCVRLPDLSARLGITRDPRGQRFRGAGLGAAAIAAGRSAADR